MYACMNLCMCSYVHVYIHVYLLWIGSDGSVLIWCGAIMGNIVQIDTPTARLQVGVIDTDWCAEYYVDELTKP